MFPHLEWEAVGENKNQGFIILLKEYLETKWNSIESERIAKDHSQ